MRVLIVLLTLVLVGFVVVFHRCQTGGNTLQSIYQSITMIICDDGAPRVFLGLSVTGCFLLICFSFLSSRCLVVEPRSETQLSLTNAIFLSLRMITLNRLFCSRTKLCFLLDVVEDIFRERREQMGMWCWLSLCPHPPTHTLRCPKCKM